MMNLALRLAARVWRPLAGGLPLRAVAVVVALMVGLMVAAVVTVAPTMATAAPTAAAAPAGPRAQDIRPVDDAWRAALSLDGVREFEVPDERFADEPGRTLADLQRTVGATTIRG